MRHHRHDVLPDEDLRPTQPVPHVPIDVQAESMRRLRALHNEIPLGYQRRDGQMTAWAVSNSLSRADMALATGLARSRVDQIVRDNYAASGSGRVDALLSQQTGRDDPTDGLY
jgi:hypothetical protein